MTALELELFGEESSDEDCQAASPQSFKARNVLSSRPSATTSTTSTEKKKKRSDKDDKFDSKGYLNGAEASRAAKWSPFQVSDDPKKTRHTSRGKDIPTNSQLKHAHAGSYIGVEFDDHNQLRAWLKIHGQPSSGKHADLVSKIGRYINARGRRLDDCYGPARPKTTTLSKLRSKSQTKADIIAAAQKAFAAANQPNSPSATSDHRYNPQKQSKNTVRRVPQRSSHTDMDSVKRGKISKQY